MRHNPKDKTQLFHKRPAMVKDDQNKHIHVDGVYKIFSVMHSGKVLSLPDSNCKPSSMKVLLQDENLDDEEELWKINGGKVESYLCSGFVIVSLTNASSV